jgi:hypothetical protein
MELAIAIFALVVSVAGFFIAMLALSRLNHNLRDAHKLIMGEQVDYHAFPGFRK